MIRFVSKKSHTVHKDNKNFLNPARYCYFLICLITFVVLINTFIMELSFIELVLWSIILCFIIAVTIQAIWLLLHKEQKGQALTDYSEWGG